MRRGCLDPRPALLSFPDLELADSCCSASRRKILKWRISASPTPGGPELIELFLFIRNMRCKNLSLILDGMPWCVFDHWTLKTIDFIGVNFLRVYLSASEGITKGVHCHPSGSVWFLWASDWWIKCLQIWYKPPSFIICTFTLLAGAEQFQRQRLPCGFLHCDSPYPKAQRTDLEIYQLPSIFISVMHFWDLGIVTR